MSVKLMASDMTIGAAMKTANSAVKGSANSQPTSRRRGPRGGATRSRGVVVVTPGAVSTAISVPGADGGASGLHRLRRVRGLLAGLRDLLQFRVDAVRDL